MLQNIAEIAEKHRLKISGAVLAIFGAFYHFFDNYEIVIREKELKRPTVVISDTRTPRDIRREIPDQEIKKPITIPDVRPTDMLRPMSWAYYIRDPILEAIRASTFNLFVIDIGSKNNFSRSDISKMKESGKTIIAYASFGEAEKFRSYWRWGNTTPSWMGKEHNLWKNVFQVRDLMNPEWLKIVEKQLIIFMDAGFDGIMISGLENQKNVSDFLHYVQDFSHARNSKFRILIQDYLEEDALPFIDGVVKQNLLYYYGTNKLNDKEITESLNKLSKIHETGKIVLIVSYATGEKWKEVKQVVSTQFSNFVLYSAPIKLDVIRFDQG